MKKVAITNRFDCKFDTYCSAIKRVGEKPFELQKYISEKEAFNILEQFDALVMTGGNDIDPSFYGEENKRSFGVIESRDRTEFNLIRAAAKINLPVLGICRGIQVANVAFGGTLWQDLKSNSFSDHMKSRQKYEFVHKVYKINDGILPKLFGDSFYVNSIHHQAVRYVSPTFTPTLISGDGIIEGMEDISKRFFVFVQFHPELLIDKNKRFLELFELLLK